MFPMKSVGGGGQIVVGTITAVPSSAGSANGLFGLPKVSVKNVEIRSATREQPPKVIQETLKGRPKSSRYRGGLTKV